MIRIKRNQAQLSKDKQTVQTQAHKETGGKKDKHKERQKKTLKQKAILIQTETEKIEKTAPSVCRKEMKSRDPFITNIYSMYLGR